MKTENTAQCWESLNADALRSVRDIQCVFHVNPSTVRRWIKRKRLRAVRVGGQLRVRTSEVLRLIQDLENQNA